MIKKELISEDEDIDWIQTEKHVFEMASNYPFLVGLHSCFQVKADSCPEAEPPLEMVWIRRVGLVVPNWRVRSSVRQALDDWLSLFDNVGIVNPFSCKIHCFSARKWINFFLADDISSDLCDRVRERRGSDVPYATPTAVAGRPRSLLLGRNHFGAASPPRKRNHLQVRRVNENVRHCLVSVSLIRMQVFGEL